MVISGAKSIKKKTALGLDEWGPAWPAYLNDEQAQDLAGILNAVEQNVTWPAQEYMNVIVLTGKPNGGIRSIALMPMIYRLWT